ncbi:MAG: hypothetical protein ABI824_14910 [Acidobacteriota bacterium]
MPANNQSEPLALGAEQPDIYRLESIRGVVSRLRTVLMDPELASSVDALNACRPQLEAALAELAVTNVIVDTESRGVEQRLRLTQQLHLLQSELDRAEALRSNASEFWKGWAKLLGVQADSGGTVYTAAGSDGLLVGATPSGKVSVRG